MLHWERLLAENAIQGTRSERIMKHKNHASHLEHGSIQKDDDERDEVLVRRMGFGGKV